MIAASMIWTLAYVCVCVCFREEERRVATFLTNGSYYVKMKYRASHIKGALSSDFPTC